MAYILLKGYKENPFFIKSLPPHLLDPGGGSKCNTHVTPLVKHLKGLPNQL